MSKTLETTSKRGTLRHTRGLIYYVVKAAYS